MPRAEAGTTKAISNKIKSKGLQRLRWYCQTCEKQCRDENGFKCHTQSESHVRQMLLVGEDPRKHINEWSNQFQNAFLQLLRTSHGEKSVNANHFYQEYISDKEHVHMNATKWSSLTEFCKHLGRESLCRVEENEKGIFIAYIDRSPETLRRQEALRKKERLDRADEERERAQVDAMIKKANAEALQRQGGETKDKGDEISRNILKRDDSGEKIKLNISFNVPTSSSTSSAASNQPTKTSAAEGQSQNPTSVGPGGTLTTPKPNPKNVFSFTQHNPASGRPNPLASKKGLTSHVLQKKRPMSEAERIMRKELERKKIKTR